MAAERPGRSLKARTPAMASAAVSKDVAMGLRMNGAEMFTSYSAGSGTSSAVTTGARWNRRARRSKNK